MTFDLNDPRPIWEQGLSRADAVKGTDISDDLPQQLRKFQADEPGFPQIFVRAAEVIEAYRRSDGAHRENIAKLREQLVSEQEESASYHKFWIEERDRTRAIQARLDRARGLLRYALADYGHPNFTDRHDMAGRIRAALTDEKSDGAIYAEVSQRNMTPEERAGIEEALRQSGTVLDGGDYMDHIYNDKR